MRRFVRRWRTSFLAMLQEPLSVALILYAMKHRIVHTVQKYLLNPPINLALDLSGLLHVAEFRHTPAEVAPLHGIRAKTQCSLVGGQRFFIPPEPA